MIGSAGIMKLLLPSTRKSNTRKYSFWKTFPVLLCTFIGILVDPANFAGGESISFNGLIMDRPKLRVVSYRVASNNPNSIREDLSCAGTAAGTGSRNNCDELVTVIENGQSLGQDGEESKEWSVPPNVTQLTVQCSSKVGPVEWDYQGKGKFPDIEINSRRITGDFWSPSTYTHYSELIFFTVTDQITGLFICRSVEKPSISNSFYMFVPQERRPILPPKEKFIVTPTPSTTGNSVVIPCRVEDREKSIHLYKRMEDGSLKRMNMDSSVSLRFNPYLGFELELSPQVYGSYVCKIDKAPEPGKDSQDEVDVDVEEDDNHKEEEISDDKSQSRKFGSKPKRREKRQMLQQFPVETSTSPGFSAFPTSEELAAAAAATSGSGSIPEYDGDEALAEGVNPDHVSLTYPEHRPTVRRRWGIYQKPRPLFIRKRVGSGSNQFSRRGGHPGQGQGQQGQGHHHPHRSRLRPRPLLGPFRRRPQPQPYLRPYPHFSHHPHHDLDLEGQGQGPMIAIPPGMSIALPGTGSQADPEKNATIFNANPPVSPSPIPSKDYFWPPLTPVQHIIHQEQEPEVGEYGGSEIPPYPPSQYPGLRIKGGLPTLIQNVNKLSTRLRPTIRPFAPTSSEEVAAAAGSSSMEQQQKQKQKDAAASASVEDSSGYSNRKKPPRKGAAGAILSPNLLPQTMNIMNSMSCVLKKVMLGPDASCDGSFFDSSSLAQAAAAFSRNPGLNLNLKQRPRPQGQSQGQGHHSSGSGGLLGGRPEDQVTLLEVVVAPLPANKFFPPEPTLYSTVPFYVKWQTESTDYSNWAEVNHTLPTGSYKLHKAGTLADHGIHSFEVFNLREGETGRISVPYVIGGQGQGQTGTGRGHSSKKKIGVHTWEFFVINSTTDSERGLKHREEGSKNIFTCKSATRNKPKIALTKLGDDGCPEEGHRRKRKTSKKKSFVEEDCGPGCVSIRTDIEAGIVHCSGDGVQQSLRYPGDLHCTGRPFFIERGKTRNLTLSANKKKLIFPCVINNPNADVYLFHQNPNGTISDVTDFTSYDLKVGFSLNLEEISDPLGTYACTSSTNVEDDSDMVTYHVNPAPSHVFNPPQSLVYGTPPFRFVWESVEELEVENKSAGNFYSGVFAKPEGNRAYVGTFEIASLERGGSGVINILRSRDKEVLHSWKYAYQGKYGLWVDKKLNIFKCASSSPKATPSLFAVECGNPNVCRLKKRFIQDDGDEDKARRENGLAKVPVECGPGCRELKVWRDRNPQGFVKCVDKCQDEGVGQGQGHTGSETGIEGMEESLTYFLSKNSTILTENDDLKPIQALEISSPIRQLRIGDGMTFVCRGNKFFYSKGFIWAIEMKNGSKRFLDPAISLEKEVVPSTTPPPPDSPSSSSPGTSTELRAEVTLRVGDKDWKAVWCYAPSIGDNTWGAASQLVYIV